jgi:hypothetical protein
MTFKDSEGIRLLADHVKSIWALSAGGIAFGSGLLGFISKDISIPKYAYLLCLSLVFGGLCAYAYSVWRGIQAHKQLTDEVFKSEQVLVTSSEATSSLDSILKTYYRSRSAFFAGCLALAVGVLGFVVWNNLLRNTSKPTYFSVSLKDASVITQDSKRIEIESLSFRITDPRSLPRQTNAVEIQDLVFKGRTLEATR